MLSWLCSLICKTCNYRPVRQLIVRLVSVAAGIAPMNGGLESTADALGWLLVTNNLPQPVALPLDPLACVRPVFLLRSEDHCAALLTVMYQTESVSGPIISSFMRSIQSMTGIQPRRPSRSSSSTLRSQPLLDYSRNAL